MRHKDNHTYMRDKKARIRNISETKEESLRKENERKILNEQKYGKQIHHEKINEGKNDRLEGNPPKSFEDTSMQTAYLHGYHEYGSRALEGQFANKIFQEEAQKTFGMLDLIHNIPEEYTKNLRKYPHYNEGRIYQMGKNTFDFIYENDINYDDYIFMMELIYPEIKSQIFRE